MTAHSDEPGLSDNPDKVQVGGLSVDARRAEAVVRRYLTASDPDRPWAYPAYDGYPGTDGSLLGEQDLFAPMLLNAGLRSLRSYYGFQAALPGLNKILSRIPLDVSLQDAEPDIISVVAELFAVLDRRVIPEVGMTRLSKVLHRKRPLLIPLWDRNIKRCYLQNAKAPIPADPTRTWQEFACLFLGAVQADLHHALGRWQSFAALTPTGGPVISPLRALDIVGWRLGDVGESGFDLS